MKLLSIFLHPFAGIVNKQIEFTGGMNVILGDNEAGKSTLMKALQMVLFEPTHQTPAAEKKLLKDVLPVGGGDMIAIDLNVENNGDVYLIKKQWGKSSLSSFNKINEAPITDPKEVQHKIDELLVQNKTVWNSVMFAEQAALSNTHNIFGEEDEIESNLDAILQNAIINNGGISPKEIQQSVNSKLQLIIKNWDLNNNKPVLGNNGLGSYDNRRQRDIGEILSMAYQINDQERNRDARKLYDEQLDTVVDKIEKKSNDYQEIKLFIEQNKNIIEDIRKRSIAEEKKQKFEAIALQLKEDFKNWNGATFELPILENIHKNDVDNKAQIHTELQIALKKQGAENRKQKLETIEKLLEDWKLLTQRQGQMQQFESDDLTLFQKTKKSLENEKIKYQALNNLQQFLVEIFATQSTSLQISNGNETNVETSIAASAIHQITADGKIEFHYQDLKIKVMAADNNLITCEKNISLYEQIINDLLKKYNLSKSEEIETLHRNYLDLTNDIQSLEKQTKLTLGNDTIASLKAEAELLESMGDSRPATTLQQLFQTALTAEAASKINVDNKIKLIHIFNAKYQSIDVLNDLQIENNGALKNCNDELGKLAALPENITNAELFITQFETTQLQERKLSDEINELRVEKSRLEGMVFDTTVAEYNDSISFLMIEKESKIQQAHSLIMVNNKLEQIMNRTAENPYHLYHSRMRDYLEVLTNGKYTDITIEKSVPATIKQAGDKELHVNQLSQGTSGLLGIALRLSMADYFLENKEGFLIFDDPMTDLDDNRQSTTTNCLMQYASSRQVIIFTCHRSHYELFGGNKMELN